jgi:tetratricopeptide (TPR) repeat protein
MKRFLPILLLLIFMAPPVCARAGEPENLSKTAIELLKNGDPEKALEILREGVSRYPYENVLRKNLEETFLAAGHRLMEMNRYEEAAERFAGAAEQFPDDPRPHFFRGVALYLARNLDLARYELERARSLGSAGSGVLFYLGSVSYDSGEIAAAIDLWQQALAAESGNERIAASLAKARRELASEEKMAKGQSSRFVLSYDSSVRPDVADRVLDALETAYNRVGADFSHFPSSPVQVILYTESDYRSVTGSPHWSGGLFDGKIRLPVRGLQELSGAIRAVLCHEYTHVVVNDIARGNAPVWLNEGLAEMQGRKEFDPPLRELEKGARDGKLLSFSNLERSFPSDGEEVTLAYQQSYSMVRYMVSTYGAHHVKDILVRLGRGEGVADSFAGALSDLGLTYADVQAEWVRAVKKEYTP